MKKKNIIFVGGIHGVGKTTYCKELAVSLNLEHYSAGDLISRFKKDSSLSKSVSNVLQNQDILLNAIDRYFDADNWYILDGHFCLLNENENISLIPFTTFESIGPRGIIVLSNDPTEIQSRLNKRDNEVYDLDLLSLFQSQEVEHSRSISQKLGIPYMKISQADNIGSALNFLKTVIGEADR